MEYPVVSKEHLEDDAAVQLQADMEAIVAKATGMHPHLAGPMAQSLVEAMREQLGGKRVYIPAPRLRRDEIEARERRDAEIAKIYNGRNLAEVMRSFSVSRATVFNALKRGRARNQSK